MKTAKELLLLACALFVWGAVVQAEAARGSGLDASTVLWYDQPATDWQRQALPIGNGRLGAMVFGGVDKEHIQFNEDSLWIGDEHDTGAYQNFGDIEIELAGPAAEADPGSYRRQLDISRAVHQIRYRHGDVHFRRVYFSSYPAQVIVLRLEADAKAAYSGTIRLVDAHHAAVTAEGNRIRATGSLDGYVYSGGSTRGRTAPYEIVLDYECQLLVLNEGGRLEASDWQIAFHGCNALTILLAADTDYVNRRDQGWKGEHPHGRISQQLAAAADRSFDQLLQEHVRDWRTLFDRCTIDIGQTPGDLRGRPTDQRLAAYRDGAPDPDLEEMLFQYARYMMISSSRPGSLPANLQGLWNHSNRPPWRCDYHTDVNVEMNYWFVDAANLSECFQPLAEWVNSIRQVRREETRKTFHTRGWITHAENGIFGGSTWKWSKGDAAWVAQNLWDHYAFTQDRQYLRTRAYPVMKELCAFWEDHLKELPDGTLVSPDGFSPEHGPQEDGVSFDQQLVWDLFTNAIEASEVLGVDQPLREKLAALRSRLLGPQIGRWGQLQEWMVDRDDPNDHHRHLSHMIAVYPGRQISPLTTPKLAEAAKVSMNARGDGASGWSRAWKIAIWARLHDGNRAYKILRELVQTRIRDNLFNAPTFQIDANFGYAAGVCEMLLQSHLGQLHFLPALPDAWHTGRVRGMRARGGLIVDMDWRDGRLTKATLHATVDGRHVLRAPQGQQIGGASTVELKAGQRVVVQFKPGPGSF